METTNYYGDKNKRKLLSTTKQSQKPKVSEDPQEKVKETVKDVGSDVLIGVLGGGLLAATLGRYAFIAGLGISGYGHYNKNQKLSALGLGLMAAGTMTAVNGKQIDPKLSTTDQIAERIRAFGHELKKKLFLDKLIPEKTGNPINGIEQNANGEPILKVVQDIRSSETDFTRNEILQRQNVAETKATEVETKPNQAFDYPEENDWLDSNRNY